MGFVLVLEKTANQNNMPGSMAMTILCTSFILQNCPIRILYLTIIMFWLDVFQERVQNSHSKALQP